MRVSKGSSTAAAADDASAAGAAGGCPDAPAVARRPGRPRSEHVEDAILDAVTGLLGEGVSYDGLSMEAIAARAGVGKAAIYRRWPNKESLVLATLERTFHSTRVPRRRVCRCAGT